MGCSNSSGGPTDGAESSANIIESALAAIGGAASSSEGALGPTALHALSSCLFSSVRSACSSGVDTLTWNGCSVGILATLSGSWVETWSSNPTCDLTSNGNTVTRTSTGQTLSLYSGAYFTMNTTAHTAYDGTSIPNTGVVVTMTNTGTSARTVNITGLRKKFTGKYGGVLFDHSMVTPTPLTVVGTRALGTRAVSGSVTVYHNLAKYIADQTFSAVTWGSPTCCYPTSGTIAATLTGSVTGTRSLNFAPGATTCGTATFTDTDSSTKSVVLTMCE